MAVIGELATLVTAKVAPFNKGLDQASARAKTFSGNLKAGIGKALTSVTGMMTRATAGITALGTALSTALLYKSVKLAAAAESMQMSYKVYLKSLEKANALLAEITKFSDATPFEPEEIKQAGKQLLAYGFAADQIMPMIKVLGDVAAGTQRPIADFVDIIGKVRAGTVASWMDVSRLGDRGAVITGELAKMMGVANSEVKKLVSTGKVGFAEVYEALRRLTAEGGLFEDAMKNLAETTEGKWSTIVGKFKGMMTRVGTAVIEGLDFKKLEDSIIRLTEAYGDDIVNMTVKGVQLLQKVLSTAPQWIEEIKALYTLWKIGSNRIQRAMPGASAAANYLFNDETDPSKYWKRLDTEYGNLVNLYRQQKGTALLRKHTPNLEPTRAKREERTQQKQAKTLVDIYRQNAERNRILMQQRPQVVTRF